MRSKNFYKFKRYYDSKLWSKKRIRDMVTIGKLTKAEYKEITAEDYE